MLDTSVLHQTANQTHWSKAPTSAIPSHYKGHDIEPTQKNLLGTLFSKRPPSPLQRPYACPQVGHCTTTSPTPWSKAPTSHIPSTTITTHKNFIMSRIMPQHSLITNIHKTAKREPRRERYRYHMPNQPSKNPIHEKKKKNATHPPKIPKRQDINWEKVKGLENTRLPFRWCPMVKRPDSLSYYGFCLPVSLSRRVIWRSKPDLEVRNPD